LGSTQYARSSGCLSSRRHSPRLGLDRLLDLSWIATRAEQRWTEAGLAPITLQQARHTAATWLDAAGLPPKIASVLMGHATPQRQPGAAQITLARYTQSLPEDIEHARALLDAYLTNRQERRRPADDPLIPPDVPELVGVCV
jgi:hypothetical protein